MLSERAVLAGHRLLKFASIDSTNAEALRSVQSGERGPLWFLADRQEAGRGRSGREWSSPIGNLHVSCLLSDPAPAAHLPELSFVAGVALIEALEEVTGKGGIFRLKWPNDVLVNGAKLAGLLLEARYDAGQQHVVIGWGVNVAEHFAGAPYPTTSLKALGFLEHQAFDAQRDALARALSESFTSWLAIWSRGQGFAHVRHGWSMRAHGVGQEALVRLPNKEQRGIFRGINEDGRFALEQEGTITLISAGDVFFSRQGDLA
jgi:BirA family biotin operon repressor/biotin-[acetyl-CoA-carboxylase] ligase